MKIRTTLAAALAVLSIALFALAGPSAWTVWDQYERTPLIGHENKKVTFKCKFCGWTKTFSWEDHFWKNTDEPVLMKHLETFHVEDIRKATTNAPQGSANEQVRRDSAAPERKP